MKGLSGRGEVPPSEISALERRIQELERLIADRRPGEEMIKRQIDAVESSMDGIAILDDDQKHIYVNKAYVEIHGYDAAEELIGQSWRILHSEDELSRFDDTIVPGFSRKGRWRGEAKGKKKDGKIFPREISLTALDGGGLTCMVRDVTDCKRAEDVLRRKTVLLEAQLNTSIDGILVIDENQKRLIINRRIIDLWDVPQHILDDEDDTALLDHVVGLVKQPQKFIEKVVYLYDHPFETSRDEIEFKSGMVLDRYSAPVLDEDGHHHGRIWTFRDITERKKTELMLESDRVFLRRVIDAVPGFVSVKSEDGRFVLANKSLAEAYGTTVRRLEGKTDDDFNLEPDKAVSVRKDDARVIRSRKVKRIAQEKITYADGTTRWLSTIKVPLIQPDGTCGQLLTVATDITHRKRAEEALQESEQKFRDLAERSLAGVYLMQEDGMVRYVNSRCAEIFGYRIDEVIDTLRVDQVIFPEDWHIVSESLDRRTSGELPEQHYEFRIVTKDRVVKHVEVYSSFTVYEGKRAIIGTLLDITERKRIEEALLSSVEELRRASSRYEALIAASKTGAWEYHDDTRFLWCSPEYFSMLGLDIKDFDLSGKRNVEQAWIDLMHPEDRNGAVQHFAAYLEDPSGMYEHYFRMRHRDGKWLWIWSRGKTLLDKDGKLTNTTVGTHIDITDRKRAEEDSIAEREKLKILSDNAPFGMVLIGRDGRFTYINAKFSGLFGFGPDDTPDGRTWFRKAYPDDGYRHTVISRWKADMEGARPGERKPRVFVVTCKDGTQKTISFIPSVLVSGDYLMTCEDITELRQLESQLRQAQKTEAIGTLAGGIAHDFNNILTSLIGYASLMQMKMDTSNPLRSYVDQILSASHKAADLTLSLLTFSRQQPITLRPVDVNGTIEATKPLLTRLLVEDIELCTILTRDDTIVMADKTQMDQILFNLVTNARDAMPKGGVLTIETRSVNLDGGSIGAGGPQEPGRYVLITVSDTGTGMDQATREKIFDPFFTTKEIGKGTGLGLASVYGIIKQHNGYITVDSEPDRGTTFLIHLPAVRTKVSGGQPVTVPVVTGEETILIAEDDEGVRRFMREALRQCGYETIEAIDGEDAIDKFRQHPNIDLIVVDSVMPKKNGREVYEEIRKIAPDTRVLFTSGYTKDVVLDKGIEDREFDFIAKPLSLNNLINKIREVLDRR